MSLRSKEHPLGQPKRLDPEDGDTWWHGEDQPGPFKLLPLAAGFCGTVSAAAAVPPALTPAGAGLPRSSPAVRETPRENHIQSGEVPARLSESNHKELKHN